MRNILARLFGGSPVALLLKLLFLSLVVGAILNGLGFTPSTIPRRVMAAIRSITNLGLGAFKDIGAFIVTGAIVVIPAWLIIRLVGRRR